MKKITVLVLTLILGAGAIAQTRVVETKETISKTEEVYLNFKFASDIKVTQWNKNEVAVSASVYLDNGKGNESFSLKTKKIDGELKIYSDFGSYFEDRQERWNQGSGKNYTSNTEINYTVYVPKGASLRIKSISGSVQINAYTGKLQTDLISGDVTLKNYDGEIRLKTVSGDLDVTINKARVDAKTVTGTVYSDLDIDLENKGKKYGASSRIKGVINNGNELITLTTVSGNIYMRKG